LKQLKNKKARNKAPFNAVCVTIPKNLPVPLGTGLRVSFIPKVSSKPKIIRNKDVGGRHELHGMMVL
jgi:hypothetical protein